MERKSLLLTLPRVWAAITIAETSLKEKMEKSTPLSLLNYFLGRLIDHMEQTPYILD